MTGQVSMPEVATIVSGDWGKEPRKRSIFVADVTARSIAKVEPVAEGWSVANLLGLARTLARSGPVLVGIDVVLGVSKGYWQLVNAKQRCCANFVEWVSGLDVNGEFFGTTGDARDWHFDCPWFAVQKGQGGLNRFKSQVSDGFLRRIDVASRANPVFAVSGIPGTVGSGTREFWRELNPLLSKSRDFNIWPFDGELAVLMRTTGVVLCESYPKLSYAAALTPELPAGPLQVAKTKSEQRQWACDLLNGADWVRENDVDLGDLSGPRASEDDFDAHMTAAGLLRCVIEGRPLGNLEWVDRVAEGSMLLAGPVDLRQNACGLARVFGPRQSSGVIDQSRREESTLDASLKRKAIMDWRDYITVDPEVCHGKACIAGTRVLVTTVLDNLASGLDSEEITNSYPSVSHDAVRAAIAYAAALANERVVALGS